MTVCMGFHYCKSLKISLFFTWKNRIKIEKIPAQVWGSAEFPSEGLLVFSVQSTADINRVIMLILDQMSQLLVTNWVFHNGWMCFGIWSVRPHHKLRVTRERRIVAQVTWSGRRHALRGERCGWMGDLNIHVADRNRCDKEVLGRYDVKEVRGQKRRVLIICIVKRGSDI